MKNLRFLFVVSLMVGSSLPTQAQTTFVWDGDTDATWNTADNWDLDSGVPGINDTAKFQGVPGATIDLGGAASVKTLEFNNAGTGSFTIGTLGVDTLSIGNAGSLFMNANLPVGGSQVIGADLLLGDGSGNDIFIRNQSLTETLTLEGEIDTGTGTASAGIQKLLFEGGGSVLVNGDLAHTGDATDFNVLVNNGTQVTFGGNASMTANAQFIIQSGGVATIADGANVSTDELQLRHGTLNVNTNLQKFTAVTSLGNGGSGGDVVIQIENGKTLGFENTVNYIADGTQANTVVIQGGTIALDSFSGTGGIDNTRSFSVPNNGNLAATEPEMVIHSTMSDGTIDNPDNNGYIAFAKWGSGTLRLTATDNNFDNTQVGQGILQITNFGALGTNDIQLGGSTSNGILEFLGGTESTGLQFRVGNNNSNGTHTGSGSIVNSGTGGVTLSAGTFNEVRTAATAARTLTLGGDNTGGANVIEGDIVDNNTAGGGTVGVTKTGSNTWVLNGDDSYTGPTQINQGRLDIGGTNTGTGTIDVADGASLGGEGQVAGDVMFGSSAPANLFVDGSTAEEFTTTGDLNVANGVTVFLEGSAAGPMDVITYGTITGGDHNQFSLDSSVFVSARGETWDTVGNTVTLDLGFKSLTWNNSVANDTWDVDVSANWHETAPTNETFFQGDAVIFDQTVAAGTITLTETMTVAGMSVTNTSFPFQFDNGGIELLADMTVFNDADVVVNSAISGDGGVVKGSATDGLSNGNLFLNAANTFTGGVTINEGHLWVGNSEALGADTSLVTIVDNGNDAPSLRLNANGLVIDNDIVFSNIGTRKDIRFELGGNGNTAEIRGNIHFEENQSWASQFYVAGGETLTLSGVISGQSSPRKYFSGVMILNNDDNSFDKELWGNGGDLQFTSLADAGVNSAAGAGSFLKVGADNSNGRVSYTGAADVNTDRQLQIGSSGGNSGNTYHTGAGTFANDGAGTLIFRNAVFNRQDSPGFNADGRHLNRVGARTLTLAGSNTGDNEIQGVIRDNAGIEDNPTQEMNTVNLAKAEAGKWILSAANTYTGTTTVTGGVLALKGPGTTGLGDTLVQTGGTLAGTGTVISSSFTAESGAIIRAGDGGFGTLNFTPDTGAGSYDFQVGSMLFIDIDPSNPIASDLLHFGGAAADTLLFNTDLTVETASLYVPTAEATFNILDWNGLTNPTFAAHFNYTGVLFGNGDEAAGLDLPDIAGSGYGWDISDFQTDGTIHVVNVVPEPSRVALLLVGFIGLALRRRR